MFNEGPHVALTKARLIARLAEQGCEIVREADAHIVVDGLRVEPVRLSGARRAFELPAGGRAIALRSNVFNPAHTVAESMDSRELGLCVGSLQIEGAAVALDCDERCGLGWHDAEFVDGRFSHRWTTGASRLPPGGRNVIVDLVGDGYYWRGAENDAAALAA